MHLRFLLKTWARRLLKLERPNYINRLIVNFQPSMTPLYLQTLLQLDLNFIDDEIEDVPESDRAMFKDHIASISSRFKESVRIVNQVLVEKLLTGTELSEQIFLIDMRDMDVPTGRNLTKLEQFVAKNAETNNCLVLFMKPIYGLRQQSLEARYRCKIRHIVLPLLDKPIGYVICSITISSLTNRRAYSLKPNHWKFCKRFPSVFESDVKGEPYPQILQHMALWKRTEFKPFYGYCYTLFSLAQTNAQIYSSMYLAANLPLLDAAAILGFDIQFSGRYRSGSDGEKKAYAMSELKVTLIYNLFCCLLYE